jgi:aryl-alcohol dehydrogenase-like predicted oxidoreductase
LREASSRCSTGCGAGCTGFDLAASYQLGGTERLFGRWMASRRNRDHLFLVGKGGHPYPGVRPNRLGAAALAADLHASLRRLGTDRLDLYLLHRDFPGAPFEPMVETLLCAPRREDPGWGVPTGACPGSRLSGAARRRAPSWARLARRCSVDSKPASLAPGRRALEPGAPLPRLALALPVLAWAPLGAGFLTADRSGGTYGSPANVARRERMRALAARRGCAPAQVALAYVFSQPFPVSAVVAASTVEKMRLNLEAARMRLSAEELQALEG